MVSMEERYEELLKVVESVERAAKPPEVELIDTSGIEEAQERPGPSFSEMLKVVYTIEAKIAEGLRAQQHPQQARAQMEAQMQQERVSAAQRRETQAPMPSMPSIKLGPAVGKELKRAGTLAAKEEQMVGKELGAFAKGLGTLESRVRSIKVKKAVTSSLVLPNLSLSDQITELERIAQGVQEGVFDRDQLEVVRQEVSGLSQVARESRESDPLTLARNQKLSEVISMLNG